MFTIEFSDERVIVCSGRLDAAQCDKAQAFLDRVAEPMVLDCMELEYISSAGLGALLKTQKRLMSRGGGLRIINVNHHILDIFRYAGFDRIFEIEPAAADAR